MLHFMNSPEEEVPLWNTVTDPVANVLDLAFGCHHRKLSRVLRSRITPTGFAVTAAPGSIIRWRPCQSGIGGGCSLHCGGCRCAPADYSGERREFPESALYASLKTKRSSGPSPRYPSQESSCSAGREPPTMRRKICSKVSFSPVGCAPLPTAAAV